jgi:hypothetical protein
LAERDKKIGVGKKREGRVAPRTFPTLLSIDACYLHDNFVAVVENLQLSRSQVLTLVQNSFRGSFLDAREIDRHLRNLEGCGI